MNQHPEKPDCLVDFLHQYRPEIPPASPQLEERILAAVAGDHARATRRKSHRLLWLIFPSIAGSFALAFFGMKPWQPSSSSAPELAQIEAFMEYTWNGVLEDKMLDSSPNWLLPEEGNP